MSVNATISLFVDTTENPPFYWIQVSSAYLPAEHSLLNGGNATFVDEQNDQGNYELELYVVPTSGSQQPVNPVVHALDLGNLTSSGDDCGIEVDVTLAGVRLGGGIPKLNNAVHNTRPIPPFPFN